MVKQVANRAKKTRSTNIWVYLSTQLTRSTEQISKHGFLGFEKKRKWSYFRSSWATTPKWGPASSAINACLLRIASTSATAAVSVVYIGRISRRFELRRFRFFGHWHLQIEKETHKFSKTIRDRREKRRIDQAIGKLTLIHFEEENPGWGEWKPL